MTRPRGAPTKYSKAVHAAICKNLEAGMSRTTAAELAGISRATLENWRDDKLSFFHDTQEAIAKAKARATVTITKAIREGDVSAAFRYLALQERSEWAEKSTVDVNVNITVEQRKIIERIAASQGQEVGEVIEEIERFLAEQRS